MSTILTIIAFVLILSILILIHEAGHFWAAKRADIKVEEFGFGFGPKLWSMKKGETLYTLNAIPFGGFVKMLGEDSHDPKALKNPRSFASKSKWQRIKVITAGVVMNFLLAFVLLSFGFMVGMEPLIVDSKDLKRAIADDVYQVQSGIVIKDVDPQSKAASLNIKAGDVVIGFTDKDGSKKENYVEDVLELKPGTYELKSGRKGYTVDIFEDFDGIEFFPVQYFPSPRVLESGHQWFTEDTYMYQLFDDRVFSLSEIKEFMDTTLTAEYHFMIWQEGNESKVPLKEVQEVFYDGVLVRNVLKDSAAEEAGIKAGDRILRLDKEKVDHLNDYHKYAQANKGEKIQYLVQSQEKGYIELEIQTNSDGKVGIEISQLLKIDAGLDGNITLYMDQIPTSVLDVRDVQYSWYKAPVESLKEMGRLSVLTAAMFGDLFKDLLTFQGVPDAVAGPVGIYQITGVVVEEGLFATLRLLALLSLSLGVINILPFPALDGGRLIFVLFEAATGKKMNQKWEAYIHAFGFIFLLLLLFIVTFEEIKDLFV